MKGLQALAGKISVFVEARENSPSITYTYVRVDSNSFN